MGIVETMIEDIEIGPHDKNKHSETNTETKNNLGILRKNNKHYIEKQEAVWKEVFGKKWLESPPVAVSSPKYRKYLDNNVPKN